MSGIHSWGDGPESALLLHCSLAHGRAWAGVARRLAGMRMVAPDLVGHGNGPDWDRSRDLHDQATEAVAGLLPESGVLIGHSFGATVALRLAIENPGRVSRLVLIEPVLFAAAGDGPGRAWTASHDGPLMPLLAAGRTEDALRKFLSVWGDRGYDALSPAQQGYMRERIAMIPAQDPALEADRAVLLPRLGEVSVPVLLVEGGDSPPVIGEIMAALDRGLPDAERVVLAGAGHMLPVTHPGPVAEAITGFMAGGVRASSGPSSI